MLPSSRRQILLGSGRSTTTAYVSSTAKMVPTELVMSGSAEFAITIDRSPKVAVGGPRPGQERNPAAPAVKPEDAGKPKAPAAAGDPDPRPAKPVE